MLFPLLALLLAPLCLAASQDSPHAQLVKLAAAANNGVITLDESTYNLITSSKRNWTASIQFTAMDKRRRCAPCREFDPAWNAVAKAWSTVPSEHRDTLFFGTLDFDQGSTVFQKLGMSSAPVVHVWAAGKNSPFKYDFQNGFEAGPLAEQLSRHTPIPIPYKAPIDWSKVGTGVGGFIIFAALLRFILPVLRNKWTWALVTILVSLVMTSGFMFVRIRGMPNSGGNGQWIAAGYQNQYGQETQVVAMIYGLLASAFLMLTVVTPYQTSPTRQRAQVYLWTAVIVIMFSILISFFRVKNRSYPFRLFL